MWTSGLNPNAADRSCLRGCWRIRRDIEREEEQGVLFKGRADLLSDPSAGKGLVQSRNVAGEGREVDPVGTPPHDQLITPKRVTRPSARGSHRTGTFADA